MSLTSADSCMSLKPGLDTPFSPCPINPGVKRWGQASEGRELFPRKAGHRTDLTPCHCTGPLGARRAPATGAAPHILPSSVTTVPLLSLAPGSASGIIYSQCHTTFKSRQSFILGFLHAPLLATERSLCVCIHVSSLTAPSETAGPFLLLTYDPPTCLVTHVQTY